MKPVETSLRNSVYLNSVKSEMAVTRDQMQTGQLNRNERRDLNSYHNEDATLMALKAEKRKRIEQRKRQRLKSRRWFT